MSESFEPAAVSEDTWRRLGVALRHAGFDEAVIDRAERILPSRHDALRMPIVLRALRREGSAGADLARFFLYDDSLEQGRVEALLGTETTRGLVAGGALEVRDDRIASRVRVTPFRGALVVSDATAGADPVIPPGPTTLQLAACLPGRLEGAVLDLGCGPGSLAVMALGAGARRVIATDLAERACAYSRATAALTERPIDVRVSDGVAAVRDERFDWIVCQPPFVPRPSEGLARTYLHGGARGDELGWRLLRESAALLTERGTMLFRLDIAGTPAEAAQRIASEVSTSSFLAFVAAGPRADELSMAYAASRSRTIDASLEPVACAYLDAFAAAGVERMSGAIVVAWEGEPRARVTRVVPSLGVVDASRIAIGRASIERAGLPDAALARVTPTLPSGAALVTRNVLEGRSQTITLESSVATPTELSEPVALLVDVIAQGASLEEAADALARAIERPPEVALDATLRFARDALRSGLLEVHPDDAR